MPIFLLMRAMLTEMSAKSAAQRIIYYYLLLFFIDYHFHYDTIYHYRRCHFIR